MVYLQHNCETIFYAYTTLKYKPADSTPAMKAIIVFASCLIGPGGLALFIASTLPGVETKSPTAIPFRPASGLLLMDFSEVGPIVMPSRPSKLLTLFLAQYWRNASLSSSFLQAQSRSLVR
jgi:hypothetical protein